MVCKICFSDCEINRNPMECQKSLQKQHYIWNENQEICFEFYKSHICEDWTNNPRRLQTLSEHQYRSSGQTLLDPLMQKFWRWLVEKLPLWWAPNAMTLVGLFCNIITSCILVYYSPDGKQEIPPLPLIFCAVGLFVYQTLDALDGKQARKTKTSSALGELFDHGCDAVSTIFVSLSVCLSVKLGEQVSLMLILVVMATALFYMAHWQTYVTGELKFAKFDVTEAQMTIIVILLVSAAFGTSFWSYQIVPSIGLDLKLAVILVTALNAIAFSYRYFHSIIFEGVGKNGSSVAIPWLFNIRVQTIPMICSAGNEVLITCTQMKAILSGGAGRNGSSVAGTSILSPFFPIFLTVVSAITIFFKSPSNAFEEHVSLYLITFGLVTAKITCKLVVAQMSKSEIDKLGTIFIGPLFLFMNQYFNSFFDEYILLWLVFFLVLLDFLIYCYDACNEIAKYLRIQILSIQYRRPALAQPPVRNIGPEAPNAANDVKHKPEFESLLMESDSEEYNQELIA